MTTDSGGRSVTVRIPPMRVLIGGVTAVALVAGLVVAVIRTHDLASKNAKLEHSLSSFEQGAVAAAKSYAVTFATYSYDDLDANFAATEAHSIDPFLSQYRSTLDQLRADLTASKASSTATIVSAGLVSITSTTAEVDLFLDQRIVNTKGPVVRPERVEMTMVRQHGQWLIKTVVLP